MFQIPDHVKIGGMKYTVWMEDHLTRDSDAAGSSCGNTQIIRVDRTLPEQLQESTFIHEVLHQLDFVYNIGLSHQQVFQLEAGIYAFLRDNPDLCECEEEQDG